jgi:glycosyltransferase involved in cell wall biosynthesis
VQVLFVGGDFPRKGGADLIDAWRHGGFANRATLHVVTNWPVESASLPPGVRLVRGVAPGTPAWVDLWRGADLFVMPTRHEAFGIVFQEAAAAGVPAVGTRIGAVPEIVEDGVTGLLVPAGDRGALVRAVRTLIDHPGLRGDMALAALRRAAALWAPHRYAATLAALITELHHQRHAA